MQTTVDIEGPAPVAHPTAATDRQLEVLSWVRSYISLHGFSPSLREIGEAFKIASTKAVTDHLWSLRRKGLITWVDGRARTLRVLEVAA